MASTYSMTPYAISFKPRYDRGSERRPIDDVNGEGGSVRSILDGLLRQLEGDDLVNDATDTTKSMRVRELTPLREFTYADLGLARSGLVGNLHRRRGTPVPYGTGDKNESFARSIFVYPEGAHEVYWLSERAGNSAFSFLEGRITGALRSSFPDLTMSLGPVAEWSALEAWSAAVSVKEMRFDAPRNNDNTQAMTVNGLRANVRVVVTPKASLKLNRVVKNDGPDRTEVFGYLSDAIPGNSSSADALLHAGWRAHVAFETPTGRQRSFGITTEDKAPTLVYTVGDTAGRATTDRPSNHDFAEACADFLNEVSDRLPVGASVADEILNTYPS